MHCVDSEVPKPHHPHLRLSLVCDWLITLLHKGAVSGARGHALASFFASGQRSGRCVLSPMAWHRLALAPEAGSAVELLGKFLGELMELTKKV